MCSTDLLCDLTGPAILGLLGGPKTGGYMTFACPLEPEHVLWGFFGHSSLFDEAVP